MTNPLEGRAREAAAEFASAKSVGELINVIDEGENVSTYVFESKLKAYVDWTISVTIFSNGEDTSISEVNLMPGENSLLAPNWVPWSERLADYKALQAELEAQAAAEAAEAAEEVEISENQEDEDSAEEIVEENSAAAEEESELAPTVLTDEGIDAEHDSDDTGKRPPRFLRRRLGRLKYKKDKS